MEHTLWNVLSKPDCKFKLVMHCCSYNLETPPIGYKGP